MTVWVMVLCLFKTYLCFQRRAGGEGERAGEADGDHPKWDRGALSNSGSSLAGLSVLICRGVSASLSSTRNVTLCKSRTEQILTG